MFWLREMMNYIFKKTNFLNEMFHTPKVRKGEMDHRLKVEEIIDFLDLALSKP